MDPFDVVALAGDALDRCRARAQQNTCGHRGRIGDPLYGIWRMLRTGVGLLTDRQTARLTRAFAADEHAAVEATWGTYQRIVSAYRQPDRRVGKTELTAVIKAISHGVPAGLPGLSRLGRTLEPRAADALAYFDRPGTSNNVRRYVQQHTVAVELPGLPGPTFDGVTELWFDDIKGVGRVFADPEYLALIRPDEARFCDMHGCEFLITTENVVHS